jgi:hypothetical protein
VKLDDGTAKTTKASTPSKKKTKDVEMKDADDAETDKDTKTKDDKDDDSRPQPAQIRHQVSSSGKHYNYVPTFYPSVPNMGIGQDSAHLRKTTVVDLLEHPPTSAVSNGAGTTGSSSQDITAAPSSNDNSSTATAATTAFGLRSALVQLGTNYWGSGWEEHELSTRDAAESANAGVKVPAGRGGGAPAGSASSVGPIVPLGRASGSRVSRILEGSMDAAAMQ